MYADLVQHLIGMARPLYVNESFGLELQATVYAFDSTTIDLCLSVFAWAPFRSTKAAIKLHTQLDLRGSIPSFIHITDGKTHDVNALDELSFEPGALALPALRLQHMKVQWGSCSPAGRITLNPHLVKAPRECIDYVLLHELCHLRHHNHSARFYKALGTQMPRWRAVKQRLDAMAEQLLPVLQAIQ